MKRYIDFILERNEFSFINYSQLKENQFVRLFNKGKDVGPFKILKVYSTNSEIPGFDTVAVQKLNDDGTFESTKGQFTIKFDETDYTYQTLGIRHTVGIVFEYNNKILLVHPTGEPKTKSFSYPKGGADSGESYEDTAVREVREETGIDYPKENLKDKPFHSLQYFKRDALKIQYFYIVKLTPEEYKRYINVIIIPKENLQLEEVNWAGFVDIKECEILLKDKFEVILNYLR